MIALTMIFAAFATFMMVVIVAMLECASEYDDQTARYFDTLDGEWKDFTNNNKR